MTRPSLCAVALGFLMSVLAAPSAHAQPPSLKGTFVMNGKDAKLANVRVMKTLLDDGEKKTPGFAVLLSEKPAQGDFSSWRSASAKDRGSFIYMMLEESGGVWVAELGHSARADGTFGVVLELNKAAFVIKDGRLSAQYKTNGEQTFSDDRFTVDETFDAPIEGK